MKSHDKFRDKPLIESTIEHAALSWLQSMNYPCVFGLILSSDEPKLEKATQTVLEQAELLAKDWAG